MCLSRSQSGPKIECIMVQREEQENTVSVPQFIMTNNNRICNVVHRLEVHVSPAPTLDATAGANHKLRLGLVGVYPITACNSLFVPRNGLGIPSGAASVFQVYPLVNPLGDFNQEERALKKKRAEASIQDNSGSYLTL